MGGARSWVAGRAGFWVFYLLGFGVGGSRPNVPEIRPPCATKALKTIERSLSVLVKSTVLKLWNKLFHSVQQKQAIMPPVSDNKYLKYLFQ